MLGWGNKPAFLGRISAGFQTFGMTQTEAELCVTQHSSAILGFFFFARFVSCPARKDQPGLLTSLSPAAQKERDFLWLFQEQLSLNCLSVTDSHQLSRK